MSRVIKALDRVFNLPDGTTDDQVKKFLKDRQAETEAGVDAVTSAQPTNPEALKTGTVNRTPTENPLIDNDSLRATVMIESGGRPDVENSGGFKGLLQLGDTRAKELGVDDPFDPKASVQGYMKHAEQTKRALENDGLEFNPFHTYLLWQQGLGGGRFLLKNQDKKISELKYSETYDIQRALKSNWPPGLKKSDITVKEWLEAWKARFEKMKTAKLDVEQWLE